jgi:Fe-S-cluster containining protein
MDTTADHDAVLEDWRQNAKANDDQNYEFLRSLKFRNYGFDPDELAAELHERVFQIVDCTRCANCCKTMDLKVREADAARIAKHLDMAIDEFAEKYLATDEEGDRKFGQTPCPFLGDDDRCTIYELRPKDCREYPHMDKKGFTFRTMGHANNALTCPAVFWIVEETRKRSVRRRKRKRRRR